MDYRKAKREFNESEDTHPNQSSRSQLEKNLKGSIHTDTERMSPALQSFARAGLQVGKQLQSALNIPEISHKEPSETSFLDNPKDKPPRKKRKVAFTGIEMDTVPPEGGSSNPRSHEKINFESIHLESTYHKIAKEYEEKAKDFEERAKEYATSSNKHSLLDQLIEQGDLHSFHNSEPSDHSGQDSASEPSPQKSFEERAKEFEKGAKEFADSSPSDRHFGELFYIDQPGINIFKLSFSHTKRKAKDPNIKSFLNSISQHLDNVMAGGYLSTPQGDARIISAQALQYIHSKYQEHPAYTQGDKALKKSMDDTIPSLKRLVKRLTS